MTLIGDLMVSGKIQQCLVASKTKEEAAVKLARLIMDSDLCRTEKYKGDKLFKVMVVHPSVFDK